MAVRAYKEVLVLTPAQEAVVESLRRQGRSLWTTLAIRVKLVLEDIEHGKRYAVARRYAELIASKKQVGMARKGFPSLRRKKIFIALSDADKEKFIQRIMEHRRNRKVRGVCKWDRKLALEYACESLCVDYQRGSVHGIESQVFHRLIDQFRDSAKRWVQWKQNAGRPRGKNKNSVVSLKAQGGGDVVKGKLDLSFFHPVLANVNVVHRRGGGRRLHKRPPSGVVKFMALSVTPIKVYAVLFIEAPASEYAVTFQPVAHATSETVIGIDPGLLTPASYSTADGSFQGKIAPPNARRNTVYLKKLARLQRKLDRQERTNNPDCFTKDGQSVRGKRRKQSSQGIRQTLRQIAVLSGRLVDRRTESYRLAAIKLLTHADTVNVGVWRPRRLGGERTKFKRNLNRRGLDVAISSLAGILRDYAKRSTVPKIIRDIKEHLSTRTCPDCQGIQPDTIPLSVRIWTCAFCGKSQDRDIAAARNLAAGERTARPETVAA